MHVDALPGFGVSFLLEPFRTLQRAVSPINSTNPYDLDILFEGNSYSLVAKAVGSAEGTRTPSGGYTRFFNGHTDPGNGVWNLGTFSYQHGASSPEEADAKQLRRLMRQASDIRHRAARSGIQLGLEEELNGIDLANQSPLAALGNPGYAEWLTQAYDNGLSGQDAILWARVQGYWDVSRGRWNAPGLGNTEPLIRRDQNRRMQAVAQAIAHRSTPASMTQASPPTVASPMQHESQSVSLQTLQQATIHESRHTMGDRQSPPLSAPVAASHDGSLNF